VGREGQESDNSKRRRGRKEKGGGRRRGMVGKMGAKAWRMGEEADSREGGERIETLRDENERKEGERKGGGKGGVSGRREGEVRDRSVLVDPW